MLRVINYAGDYKMARWHQNPSAESFLKMRFFLGFGKEECMSSRYLNINIKLIEVFQNAKTHWNFMRCLCYRFLSQKGPEALADFR